MTQWVYGQSPTMACGLSRGLPSFHRHTGDCAPFQRLGQVSPARLASSSALTWSGLTGWPFCINAKPIPFSETSLSVGDSGLKKFNTGAVDTAFLIRSKAWMITWNKTPRGHLHGWVCLLSRRCLRSSRNPSRCWQSVEQLVHRLVWVYCKWVQLYVDRASILQTGGQ